ncbi:MAG: hypothetical protein A2Y62_08845 [Candidatus Fischerbacteria bacterium RBG_13_37_8]|uniref:Transposase IS4-like domain-containing protein n=1 Tax=Candidatus Fischerbacteria bacterium RBG_13_37_8 TaxID=1817863 RepID=A0A1F5VX60_9BACT|nr:MAG: hypothetical protein A2Y62_08845 [Candidatus Fischerbacteria bacterium RBG_13_37_8]
MPGEDEVQAASRLVARIIEKYPKGFDVVAVDSLSQLGFPIRVVRSREIKWKGKQQTTSDWLWATTLTKNDALTDIVCQIGHSRWDIENQGFNEAVTFYNIDHCFVHLLFIILNSFQENFHP